MKKNTRLSNMFFSALMPAAIILMFAVSVFAQSTPTPVSWSSPTTIGGGSGVGVAGSGNIVHVVNGGFEPWLPTPTPPTPDCSPSAPVFSEENIIYRRSINQGASFAPPVPISFPTPSPSPSPTTVKGALFLEDNVMTDGNTVAVVYYNGFTLAKDFFPGCRQVGSIYVVVSLDGGANWKEPVKLNDNPAGKALRHSIAIVGKNIHVVWMDFRASRWDIHYRRLIYSDLGELSSLSEDKLLVQGMKGAEVSGAGDIGAERPQIAANGATIHVAWMDGRDNNAGCFIEGSPPTWLPQCTEIYYAKSTNNGTSFLGTPPTPIPLTDSTTTLPTYSGRPDIVTDGSNTVYVLYDKRTPEIFDGKNELFLRKSINNNDFAGEVRLTDNPGVSTHSSGIVVGPTLYTIWINNSASEANYTVFSRDGDLATPSGNQQELPSSLGAGAPILGASRSYIHAIWNDKYSRRPVRTPFDFDGDGRSDISVFRPSTKDWWILPSFTNVYYGTNFGLSNDILAPADYDGDGKTDIAVYRASNGTWYILRSSSGSDVQFPFGTSEDIPQPADFDGDGKAELAVYRPSNGTWYVKNLTNNSVTGYQFGMSGDKPLVGDYDGDGKADYAVYRPSNGTWYLQRSTQGYTFNLFGSPSDKFVPADYDGDGKTDMAFYHPTDGVWNILQSTNGFVGIQDGISTDIPSPADYDGDGKTDVAVYRPSNGTWYILQSSNNFALISTQFGIAEDKPVSNAFVK